MYCSKNSELKITWLLLDIIVLLNNEIPTMRSLYVLVLILQYRFWDIPHVTVINDLLNSKYKVSTKSA